MGLLPQIKCLQVIWVFLDFILKKNVKANENFEQHTSVDIQQIVNSWIRLTNPDKAVSAFNQVGIYQIEITDNVYVVRADIKKARAIR
ncbi:hypothetical protein M9Y10_012047 [Tritrichomonas musculus]|uniref:Uncharacterized protein n=1 Tax=Tritrichomonas musculus TaxID=1915356 RepID=A0ABR2ICI9_9EUKA